MAILLRILFGVLKGGAVGGGLGAGLWALDPEGTTLAWLRWPLYGVIGFVTGAVCGKPPWSKNSAWVATIIKAVVGFGVSVGLFFLADWLLNFQIFGRTPTLWYFGFGGVLGIAYGIWVEIDDGGPPSALPEGEKKPALEEGDKAPQLPAKGGKKGKKGKKDK